MINTAPTANEHACETCAVDSRVSDSCVEGAPDSIPAAGDGNPSIADLVKGMRENNRTLLHQSERIEELQSVLNCILYLTEKARRLERENDC